MRFSQFRNLINRSQVRFHLKRAFFLRFSAKNAFIAILTQALENLQKK